MQVWSGQGGTLYRLGEPYRFGAAMEDCGDGFDWRPADPALRYWLDEPVCFKLQSGEPLEPLAVCRRSGRVAFGRCLRGLAVRASGICLPLTVVATCASWRLEARFGAQDRPTLGRDPHEAPPLPQTLQAVLTGIEPPLSGSLLAVLSFGAGAFVGRGDSTGIGPGMVLAFDQEGVEHVLC